MTYDIQIANRSNRNIPINITVTDHYKAPTCCVNITSAANPQQSFVRQFVVLLRENRIEPAHKIVVPYGKKQLLESIGNVLSQNKDPRNQIQVGDYLFSVGKCTFTLICNFELMIDNQRFAAIAAQKGDYTFMVTYENNKFFKNFLQDNEIAIKDFEDKLRDIYDKVKNKQYSYQARGRKLISVEFIEGSEIGVYHAEIKGENCDDSIRLHYQDSNNINIYRESDEGKLISVNDSWLLEQIRREFKRAYAGRELEPYIKPQSKNIQRNLTKRDRVKNATASNLLFYRSNQALRETYLLTDTKRKNIHDLTFLGVLHPLDLSILTWVNELRYITNEHLLDLVEAGHVAPAEPGLNKAKLNNKLQRLLNYGLLDRSIFVTLSEQGNIIKDVGNKSIAHIYTMGKNGSNLLYEIGRSDAVYKPFERYQDGNMIKAKLAANQFLVYWLYAYPNTFSQNYYSSRTMYVKGVDGSGARLHASVICKDTLIVGEPVRRDESFHAFMLEKFERFMTVFDASNNGNLYQGHKNITLPPEKIICYICESEEHIHELHALLKEKYEKQEIWFTTDLKTHNYNEEGKRFIVFNEKGEPEFVDLNKRFGLEKERADWEKAEENSDAKTFVEND